MDGELVRGSVSQSVRITYIRRTETFGGLRPTGNWRRVWGVSQSSFYKTEQGTIFRLKEDDEGRLSVELLQTSLWVQGPIGMAGLRVAPTTTKLTERQIQSLPQ